MPKRLLLLSLAAALACADAGASAGEGAAAVRREDPAGADRVRAADTTGLAVRVERLADSAVLRLLVENRGDSARILVRPREWTLMAFQEWGGWELDVQGPGGRYTPVPFPGFRPPHSGTDVTELRPGESFGLLIDLRRYARYVEPDHHFLAETPGEYTVIVRYYLEKDHLIPSQAPPLLTVSWTPSAGASGFITLPELPPVRSAPLTFTIPGAPRPGTVGERAP